MNEQVIILSLTDKEALGAVRCFPGLQAAETDGLIWVRGIPAQGKADVRIQQLPALHTYTLNKQNLLFPAGALTPVSKLKDLPWIPLSEYITVKLPVSGLPGSVQQKHPLRLVPSGREENGNALLTELNIWKQYVEGAPLARLQPTRFAVADDGRVFVMGTPLVPIPGKEYILRNRIALPAGYDFDPPLVAGLIAVRLNPLRDALLLFDIHGNWERIPLQRLEPTSRSAVRQTNGRLHE